VGQVADVRAFRFGVGSWATTRPALLADAHQAESLGYDVFLLADHLFDWLAPIPMGVAVAENTSLRVGTHVLSADFRHPVVMAKEAATLDVLSEGRLELGLGAGYLPFEYKMAGISFDNGVDRLARLADTVQIVNSAFTGEPFSFAGSHFHISDYTPAPVPVQQPRPPLLLGGGGPALLTFAAQHADIVSIMPASAPSGGMRASEMTLRSLQSKAADVREKASLRDANPEINILIFDAVITTDRRTAAGHYLDELAERLPFLTVDSQLTVDDLLGSPYLAFGTHQEITEHLGLLREQTGVSYIAVLPPLLEGLGPVVTALHGK
jgi:probable F420-dependent oxidoreductase